MDIGLKTALLAIVGVAGIVLATLGVIAATSGSRRHRAGAKAGDGPPYSPRSVSASPTCDARHAGTALAASPVASRTTTAPTNATGSVGEMP